MQDRYAGDIGDYIKLALLRHLGVGRKLGVAWYLVPDQSHNADGRHTSYLSDPHRWRRLDPELFDALSDLVSVTRSVNALERVGIPDASYTREPLISADMPPRDRSQWRGEWFDRAIRDLDGCDLVFADPDNGLVDNQEHRRSQKVFRKQIPVEETKRLADRRTAIVYHHNSRFKGGHAAEVRHWCSLLGSATLAVRANAFSCRTFFIVNADQTIRDRATEFCERWRGHSVHLFAVSNFAANSPPDHNRSLPRNQ